MIWIRSLMSTINKSLISNLLLLLFLSLSSYHANAVELQTPCTIEDKEYADFWENYYSPDEAYLMGKEIQKLIADKDLKGLASLMPEYGYPHRVEYLFSRSFDEHFPQDWIDRVMEEPECRPIGWRGFVLGSGQIWYDKNTKTDAWHISINYFNRLPSLFPKGWVYNGKTLHPLCFETGFKDDAYPITLEKCLKAETKEFHIYEPDGLISASDFEWERMNYSIIKEVSLDECNRLSKNTIKFYGRDNIEEINGECLKSYLISATYNGGGTWTASSVRVWGLFELENKIKEFIPLTYSPK